MRSLLLILLLTISLAGCKERNGMSRQYNTEAVLKISVLKSGEILADGNRVSLMKLGSLLTDNAQKNGVVWYYREAGKEEPPPQAMNVIKLVIEHNRPTLSACRNTSKTALNSGCTARQRQLWIALNSGTRSGLMSPLKLSKKHGGIEKLPPTN